MLLINFLFIILPVIIFLWMFSFLFIKYPLSKYDLKELLSNPALSDYGFIEETRDIYNRCFILVGLCLAFNSVYLFLGNNISISELPFYLVSTISIMFVGLFPLTKDFKNIKLRIFHWTSAFLGLLLYPIILFFTICNELSLSQIYFYLYIFLLVFILVIGFCFKKKIITELFFIILSTVLSYVLNILIFFF